MADLLAPTTSVLSHYTEKASMSLMAVPCIKSIIYGDAQQFSHRPIKCISFASMPT